MRIWNQCDSISIAIIFESFNEILSRTLLIITSFKYIDLLVISIKLSDYHSLHNQ